jgi:hypothetical protein
MILHTKSRMTQKRLKLSCQRAPCKDYFLGIQIGSGLGICGGPVPEWPRKPASQSTLVAADMARWDAQAAQHRAATPAGAHVVDFIWLYRRCPRIVDARTTVTAERIGRCGAGVRFWHDREVRIPPCYVCYWAWTGQ